MNLPWPFRRRHTTPLQRWIHYQQGPRIAADFSQILHSRRLSRV